MAQWNSRVGASQTRMSRLGTRGCGGPAGRSGVRARRAAAGGLGVVAILNVLVLRAGPGRQIPGGPPDPAPLGPAREAA